MSSDFQFSSCIALLGIPSVKSLVSILLLDDFSDRCCCSSAFSFFFPGSSYWVMFLITAVGFAFFPSFSSGTFVGCGCGPNWWLLSNGLLVSSCSCIAGDFQLGCLLVAAYQWLLEMLHAALLLHRMSPSQVRLCSPKHFQSFPMHCRCLMVSSWFSQS